MARAGSMSVYNERLCDVFLPPPNLIAATNTCNIQLLAQFPAPQVPLSPAAAVKGSQHEKLELQIAKLIK